MLCVMYLASPLEIHKNVNADALVETDTVEAHLEALQGRVKR